MKKQLKEIGLSLAGAVSVALLAWFKQNEVKIEQVARELKRLAHDDK